MRQTLKKLGTGRPSPSRAVLSGMAFVTALCLAGGAWAATRTSGEETAVSTDQTAGHRLISRGEAAGDYQGLPDACRAGNGDIIVVFYAGSGYAAGYYVDKPDWPKGGGWICMVRSSDEGHTWTSPQVLYHDGRDNRDPHIARLSDGALVCSFFTLYKEGEETRSPGAQIVRSHDDGRTWEKQAQDVCPEYGCSAPVRQLPDGTCILGVYHEKWPGAWGGVVRSTDMTKTWSEPIPIGKGAGIYLDAETDVIRLKDGRLYAALRSSVVNMHYATSADGGLSWTDVKDIGFPSHCPHLNRLSTGEVLLTVRRPKELQTSLYVSRDECATWQGPYLIDATGGAYPSTVELKDGSILVVYYSLESNAGSAVRARRFRLGAEGIEPLPL
jgi:sialidase-1